MEPYEIAIIAAEQTLRAAGYQTRDLKSGLMGRYLIEVFDHGKRVGHIRGGYEHIGVKVGKSRIRVGFRWGRGWIKLNAKGADAALFDALMEALAEYAAEGQA